MDRKKEKRVPFLRFKGFEKDFLKKISPEVIEKFSRIVSIPKEIIKIELLTVETITETPLSLEIFMFQRAQEIHDALASVLHDILSEHGYKNVHIFFVMLNPSFYYKEGNPLK
jgi:hypothetical protein